MTKVRIKGTNKTIKIRPRAAKPSTKRKYPGKPVKSYYA